MLNQLRLRNRRLHAESRPLSSQSPERPVSLQAVAAQQIPLANLRSMAMLVVLRDAQLRVRAALLGRALNPQ